MTAKPSIVYIIGEPDDQFTRVPNALIRDPEVTPPAMRVILWFASQAPGRAVYLTKLAEETGLARRTMHRALAAALESPYLTRTPTGGHDTQGNATYVYTVDLTVTRDTRVSHATDPAEAPCAKSSHGRVPNLATKKTNASFKSMPSPGGEGGTATSLTTVDRWSPKPRHWRKLDELGLDRGEVLDTFDEMFRCDDETCNRKPRSSNWDPKFSKFIEMFAEGRHEIEFKAHHHDDEVAASTPKKMPEPDPWLAPIDLDKEWVS
ncbi:hypothetical protein ACPCG0_11740 [Propionibacteriaceae bacterium Y1923]|uniref:hypothetical protein n=1 Tax=Aestuariimicrobium sp. Y1814 TaxID=3418742 RepID=UPI003C1CDDD9